MEERHRDRAGGKGETRRPRGRCWRRGRTQLGECEESEESARMESSAKRAGEHENAGGRGRAGGECR